VFDALCHKRCYKDAWLDEQVRELFEKGRGSQFDPWLVGLFLDNIADFFAIKNMYPDR